MRSIFYCGLMMVGALSCPAQQPAPNPAPATAPTAAPTPAAAPAAPVMAPAADQELARKAVEDVYNTWRVGMQRGSEPAWRRATSASRQVKVRNMIVSQKGQFPADFFRNHNTPLPALENFKYVGTMVGARGVTMAATYIGKMQLGNGKPTMNAYVLQFVYERTGWKLDQANFFNLEKLPKVQARLEKGDLSVLREQDGFFPYETIPAAPAACRAPELIGKVFVDAPGREIEMRINGVSAHEFNDERRADIISGGLRRGQNTITYTIKTDKNKDHPSMAIGLFVMPETPGNHPVCVFDHILDSKDEANGGSFTFTIDNALIGSMNPKRPGPKPQPFHAVPLKQKK